MLVTVAASLVNMYYVPRYARDDWRGLTRYLKEHGDPRADVVLLDVSLMLPFDLYGHNLFERIEVPLAQSGEADAWAGARYNFRGRARVWLVTTANPVNVHRFYDDEAGQRAFAEADGFKRAMDARYRVVDENWFPGLVLTEYRVTP
jgi:hypothetical protein